MIKHIVFFKFEDYSKELAIKSKGLLKDLAGKVPQLRTLEVGEDLIRSDRSYDIALITTFDSLDDLAKYQVDPEHQKVAVFLRSVCQSIVAVDFETSGV